MIKLIAFDVDNTLAKLNENIKREDVILLRELIDNDIKVMLLSGKPTAYLAGFARQIGRKGIIISGENGLDIHFDIEFPSSKVIQFPVTEEQLSLLTKIKKEVSNLGQYFFQPNRLSVTPFFLNDASKDTLYEYAKQVREQSDLLDVYIHSDCVDFTPKGVSKGVSISHAIKELNVKKSELITVGDGENDVPMFNMSDNVLIVGNKIKHQNAIYFNNTNEMLKHLITLL